jgi:quinol-cytochrome oxidoreductase complex cytochrome b subunit
MAGLMGAISSAASRLWTDIKASTDAGLLAFARSLGLIYGPIDTTLPIDRALRKSLRRRLPAWVGWRHALGGVSYFLFIVLVVTGLLLAVHYRPSAQEAYASIQHITSDITFGWLVRDAHAWAASLLVIVVLAHMARVFYEAAYLSPRETNWLVGVLLLFLVLVFGATGYLLPWDQWSYWTVTEAFGAVERLPLIGAFSVKILRGDPIVSGATLSRFFAAHVILLPWVALALLGFHVTLVRRHGIAPPQRAPATTTGRPFYPHHLLRSFMVVALATAVIITFAVVAPRPMGAAANPETPPEFIRSTWIVADVSRALSHFLGGWGFVVFSVLGVGLALVPLFHRGTERSLRRRPKSAAFGLLFIVAFLVAWIVGRQLRTVPAAIVEPTAPASQPLAVDSSARANPATSRPDSAARTEGTSSRAGAAPARGQRR